MNSEYKTYNLCRMCRSRYAPDGKDICTDCQKLRTHREEARRYRCPICGVDPGYGCFTRRWYEGMYDGGSWKVVQGDPVHSERHPDYVSPEPSSKRKSFWKQAWHFWWEEKNVSI